MELDYEKDVTIDETALDVESLDQQRRVVRYGRHLTQLSKSLELAKENLNITKAELDMQIRQIPGDFGITGKITEAQVTNAILMNENYQKKSTQCIELKYEYEMAKIAFQAIVGRRDSLQNLITLHGQQYFAGPRTPRNLSDEWEKRTKEANNRVASNLRVRRKA